MAMYLINRSRIHLARQEAAAAEPLLREALQIRRRVMPETDWRIAAPKSLLGATLTDLGRYDEAEPLLREAHDVLHPMKDTPGHRGREALANASRLVALYEAWGQAEKATPYRAP